MKQAAKFFIGIATGFGLVLILYLLMFYLNLGVPTESSRWCYEINQKKCLAAAKINSPKLLLVGGSATLFGIRAREIQQQTGWPTVNLGTHAVLGATYMLREAQKVAKPGDVVLLTFEYELYRAGRLDPVFADQGLIDYVLARDPQYFWELPAGEKWNFFMLASTSRLERGLKNRARAEKPGKSQSVYDSGWIDETGDQMHTIASSQNRAESGQILKQTSLLYTGFPKEPPAFEMIQSFCDWAKTNHVRVLATFPNLCDKPEYHLPPAHEASERIRQFYATLQVPVLGDYTDSILPVDCFFDTNYHLTQEASLERTRKLVPELKPYLN